AYGACIPDNSMNPELPNGIDDNCDGDGLGDEFCNGLDDDGDGRIDEDAGSCLMRILLVPLCWSGDDADFEAAVADQQATFIDALGLNSCQQTISFVSIPPSTLNVLGATCTGGMFPAFYQDVEAGVEALADPNFA